MPDKLYITHRFSTEKISALLISEGENICTDTIFQLLLPKKRVKLSASSRSQSMEQAPILNRFKQGSYVFRNSEIQGFPGLFYRFFPGFFQGSWTSRMKTTFTTNCIHYKATMCSKCSDSILSSGF